MYHKLSLRVVSSGKVTDGLNSPLALQQKWLSSLFRGLTVRGAAYGTGGSEGKAEGAAAGLASSGGTVGSDLSSWRTASVAVLSVEVEPASSEFELVRPTGS